MRTKEEIKAEINDLERSRFYIEMIDHWSHEDREEYEKISAKIKKLEEELEAATE